MKRLTDMVAIVGTIDPQLLDDGTATSDKITPSDFHSVGFVLSTGAVDTTCNFKLVEYDSDGSNGQDLSSKAITALDGDDDNKQFFIHVNANELSDGYSQVAASVISGDGTAGCQVSVVAMGYNPRYEPASVKDIASVTQIV